MADGSKIEWTDATWNPITGCSVVSPGCTNCYAMKLAGTRLRNHPSREGLTRDTKAGPVWTGEVRLNEDWLTQPLRWKKPRMIFVCAHGDLFAENVPDEWIDRVFAVMALAPQHTFQVLTKRAARMREYMCGLHHEPRSHLAGRMQAAAERLNWFIDQPGDGCFLGPRFREGAHGYIERPFENVWLGVSAEDQTRADERIPLLLDTPAAVRWVSAEPLLGPIDFRLISHPQHSGADVLTGHDATPCPLSDPYCESDDGECHDGCEPNPRIDWIVAGGESGSDARPMHPDWVRSIREQCRAAFVPFHFKQWGEWGDYRQIGADSWAYSVMKGTERCGVVREGGEAMFEGRAFPTRYPWRDGGPGPCMVRVGKKLSGRTLDGQTHDEWPRAYGTRAPS